MQSLGPKWRHFSHHKLFFFFLIQRTNQNGVVLVFGLSGTKTMLFFLSDLNENNTTSFWS